jgi:hypothetical protein
LDSDEPAEEDNMTGIDEKGQYIPETLETLYPGETPIVDELVTEDLADIYNQFQNEDEPGDEFEKIVDHAFTDGILLFSSSESKRNVVSVDGSYGSSGGCDGSYGSSGCWDGAVHQVVEMVHMVHQVVEMVLYGSSGC